MFENAENAKPWVCVLPQSRLNVISSAAKRSREISYCHLSGNTSAPRSSQFGLNRLIRSIFFARDHFFGWDSLAKSPTVQRYGAWFK
jgi:hypothetical protein